MTRAIADLIDTDPITLSEATLMRDVEREFERQAIVYFITGGDAVKIGYSTTVYKRLGDLQSASSEPLTLADYALGTRRLEKELHKLLASERIKGEWFRQSDKTMDLIYLISDFLELFDDDDEDRDGRDVHELTVEELHDIMARPYYWRPGAVAVP